MDKLVIPAGRLASEEDAAAKIRAELAKKLRDGKPIELNADGNVMGEGDEQTKLVTQPGKLASYQWYDREPQRLRDEIEGMNRFFPQFQLHKMDATIGTDRCVSACCPMAGRGRLRQSTTTTIRRRIWAGRCVSCCSNPTSTW